MPPTIEGQGVSAPFGSTSHSETRGLCGPSILGAIPRSATKKAHGGVRTIETPGSDLAFIKHVWRMMEDAFNRNHSYLIDTGKLEATLQAFQHAPGTEWAAMPQDKIDNITKLMDSRINHLLACS